MESNPEGLFTPREVSQIIGLTRRQIQHWDQTQLIRPSIRTQGGHSRYTFQDLIAFKTAKKLLEAGVSLQRIRRSLAELQRLLPMVKRPLSELTLVATGDVILVFYQGTVFEAVSGQEWIIEVSEVKQSVEKWQNRLKDLKEYRKVRRARSGPLSAPSTPTSQVPFEGEGETEEKAKGAS
jgi:DNA-binding transcriptional MerR regulator